MSRQVVIDQITQAFGSQFSFHKAMPDAVLEQYWSGLSWVLSDSALSGRDKALISFGTAAAIHCEY